MAISKYVKLCNSNRKQGSEPAGIPKTKGRTVSLICPAHAQQPHVFVVCTIHTHPRRPRIIEVIAVFLDLNKLFKLTDTESVKIH